jgi:hypothetical protein
VDRCRTSQRRVDHGKSHPRGFLSGGGGQYSDWVRETWLVSVCFCLSIATGCGGDGAEDETGAAEVGLSADPTGTDGAGSGDAGGDGDASGGDGDGSSGDEDGTGDGDGTSGDGDGACPFAQCEVIPSFPYSHDADTSTSTMDDFDAYACAPSTGEMGPERAYMFTLSEAGTVLAMIDDGATAGTDVDVHLLDGVTSDDCLRRGHKGVSANLGPGTYYLLVDSWSDGTMASFEGPYTLQVRFVAEGSTCAMLGDPIPRIGTTEVLDMPATGMVVKEAHLVTDQDVFGGNGWPTAIGENIAAHHARTETQTGYVMNRTEPWAPCCEPSSRPRASATSPIMPSMGRPSWSRPATRMGPGT